MTPAEEIARVARERFGLEALRPEQTAAISASLAGRDVLVVWATGAGKSAVYQVTAALRPGVTVVVSPLIALQEDQLSGLGDAPDAPKAVVVNSARGVRRREQAWEQLETGAATYVLLAPEQLAREDVVARLADVGVSMLVVDEAHCIASWGHDFRPDYLMLGAVAARWGRPPVIALTATASTPVREEIIERLGLRDPELLLGDVDRPGIRLDVRRHGDEQEKRRAVLDEVAGLAGPGLLYVATRRAAEEYAAGLAGRGPQSLAYHGGLPGARRREVHEAFLGGTADVVVATSAFGMGIDKDDVRFVVHADIPDSVDAYSQELGRAGRDGEPAQATLHYRPEDLALRRYFATKNPDAGELRALLKALRAGHRRGPALAEATGLSARRVTGLLTLLADTASVRLTRAGAVLAEGVDTRRAVREALRRVEERERIDRSRIDVMREYAETRRCRRQVLLGYFGQELDEPCGHCDTCDAAAAAPQIRMTSPDSEDSGRNVRIHAQDPNPETPAGWAVDDRVEHREWGPGTVVAVEDDRMRVFFEREGYKLLSLEVVERESLLSAR